MRLSTRIALGAATALVASSPAVAADVYIALGDSITFGETDLRYVRSLGDRGYVNDFADVLAGRNGGVRPGVINLAIDGETAASFQSGIGRTPPVVGRTDLPLALQNANYSGDSPPTQGATFAARAASERAAGNTIANISITLGFNELAALSSLPTDVGLSRIDGVLSAYRANYSAVLTQVSTLAPGANVYLLGYFNPFVADPGNPAGPIFAAAGARLNATIEALAAQFGFRYVDTFTPFVGREAELTFIDDVRFGQRAPAPYSAFDDGLAPIGNVHPNETGYAVIAGRLAAVSAVPEPATWGMMLIGFGAIGYAMRRRPGGKNVVKPARVSYG